jgi:excisionase family DNA binding protein
MFAALAAAAAGGAGPEGTPVFTPSTPVMPYDVLTPAEAAAYLQVGEGIVIEEANAGRLPGQKLGGQWRFLRLAIAEWLRSGQLARPLSWKDRIREVIGAWKDDPTVDEMVENIYRERKRHPVGGA